MVGFELVELVLQRSDFGENFLGAHYALGCPKWNIVEQWLFLYSNSFDILGIHVEEQRWTGNYFGQKPGLFQYESRFRTQVHSFQPRFPELVPIGPCASVVDMRILCGLVVDVGGNGDSVVEEGSESGVYLAHPVVPVQEKDSWIFSVHSSSLYSSWT